MKPILSAVFLTLTLTLCACPGPGNEPPPVEETPDGGGAACVKDADCGTGKSCCGGACVDLTSDTTHCGSCGNTCSAANGSAVCTAGVCAVSMCTSGHANCDGTVANGCETNVSTDVENCGACGNACSAPNATSTCTLGVCGLDQCSDGFADCNAGATDGCETNLRTDDANCGACNHACADGESCNNGVCEAPAYLYGYGGQLDFLGSTSDEVWRFSVTTRQFEILPTQGDETPGPRTGDVGAYDKQGNRMIVWGGSDQFASTLDADVWALDFSTQPATWTRLSSGSVNPGGRLAACSGYDAANRILYVFGGMDEFGTMMNDLWKFDLATESWTLIDDGTQIAPQAYVNPACAYQPEAERFVVFGGSEQNASAPTNDLWVRKVNAAGGWENLALQSTPTGRMAAQFFDGSSPLALFGGADFDESTGGASFPTDVTALTVNPTWEQQLPDGQSGGPAGRFGHSAAVLNGRYYVYGGAVMDPTSGFAYEGDLWEYDPSTKSWTELVANDSSEVVPAGKLSALVVAPR